MLQAARLWLKYVLIIDSPGAGFAVLLDHCSGFVISNAVDPAHGVSRNARLVIAQSYYRYADD